ncbi:MAG: hypothetical protein WBB98_04720 [Xanthobacteraceae bacterium]
MGFNSENAKQAVRLFERLTEAKEESERVGDGRTVEEVYISRGFGDAGVEVGRKHPLFPELLDMLIRVNKARVYDAESKLRDLGAEVPE